MDNTISRSALNDKIIHALVNFHKVIEDYPITKDTKGYNYMYASLDSVLSAIRKPLTDCGLVIVQSLKHQDNEDYPTIVTSLYHTSGQWLQSELAIRPTKSDAQGVGSSISYARRYSILALLNLAPEDDDGAEASKPGGNMADMMKIKEHNNNVKKAEESGLTVGRLYAKSNVPKAILVDLQEELQELWEALDV
mgnify:CR=1 FL=1|tara:strand:- start:18246 stop:18827 length:582 start_codon:yes stop_codon:yes gene_type:complete